MTDAFDTRLVSGPAGRLAVTTSGDPGAGPNVVLLHPINTASLVWHPVMRLLDSPSVAIDLRGHGGSDLDGPFTIEDGYLPDVMAVLDELELDSVHLVGGSLGGSIGIAVAASHPERVASVTTFGSTLGTGVSEAEIEAMICALADAGCAEYFAGLVPAVVGTRHRAAPGLDEVARVAGARPEPTVADILRAAFRADIRGLAGRVSAPVLAVGGTEDPTCPPAMTLEIATATGGSHVLLDGVGHLPMVEVPADVAALINRHIAQTQGGRP